MIALGCDHGGYELMQEVKKHLEERGLEYKDFGCNGPESVDYPVYGKKVAQAIVDGECEKGILICGTGIGMAISANKFPGIRAAVCHDIFSTERSVLSNNCSVMCMGERVIGKELAIKMVEKWISLEFVDGSSTPKVNAIKEIERETMVEPDKIAHTKKKIG